MTWQWVVLILGALALLGVIVVMIVVGGIYAQAASQAKRERDAG